MSQNDVSATLALLTPEAVRQRCHEVFEAAEVNALDFFQLNIENFDSAVELVLTEIAAAISVSTNSTAESKFSIFS